MNRHQRLILKNQLIYDLVELAVDIGSKRWLSIFNMRGPDGVSVHYKSPFLEISGLEIEFSIISDIERNRPSVTCQALAAYITALRKWTLWRFHQQRKIDDWRNVRFDIEDADVFLQMTLLGGIRYHQN